MSYKIEKKKMVTDGMWEVREVQMRKLEPRFLDWKVLC